jgi:dipeptidyl aminopeptidase/acylaminoacyl peptidase
MIRKTSLLALVFVFATPLALAQAKHPFTFEDMMKLKRVGEPVPSPDGKWVVFSVVDVSLEANTKTPHIWIVPLSTTPDHVGTAAPGRSAERSSASVYRNNSSNCSALSVFSSRYFTITGV